MKKYLCMIIRGKAGCKTESQGGWSSSYRGKGLAEHPNVNSDCSGRWSCGWLLLTSLFKLFLYFPSFLEFNECALAFNQKLVKELKKKNVSLGTPSLPTLWCGKRCSQHLDKLVLALPGWVSVPGACSWVSVPTPAAAWPFMLSHLTPPCSQPFLRPSMLTVL